MKMLVTDHDKELRLAFLARGTDNDNAPESYFFPLLVAIERDEPGNYSATVIALEAKILANGVTPDSAAAEAVEAFKEIVDTAIEQGLPLEKVIGSGWFKRTQIPIDQAGKVFQELEKLVDNQLEQTDHWSQINAVSPGFIPWAAEHAL